MHTHALKIRWTLHTRIMDDKINDLVEPNILAGTESSPPPYQEGLIFLTIILKKKSRIAEAVLNSVNLARVMLMQVKPCLTITWLKDFCWRIITS